jgi:hypothetical protein
MKTFALIGALGAVAALSACQEYYGPSGAAAAPNYATPASATAPAHACFRTHDIRNHTFDGDHTAYIRLTDRSVYRIETNGACFAGATSSDPLVMRNPPGSTYVCRPIDLDIGVKVAGGPTSHCIVGGITPVTPAEVAALPPKLRP